MFKLSRISIVLCLSALMFAMTGCGSKNAEPAVEAEAPMEMRTVDAPAYTMAIPTNWKFNISKDGKHADIIDENDQPRLSVNVGRLAKKQTALQVAKAHAKKLNGSAPALTSPSVYGYTVEARSGEQVPVTLYVRGKNYATTQQYRADDKMAQESAGSVAMK